jgi:CheY-like chemotaxis protein
MGEINFKNRSVLIVEDDEVSAQFLIELLEDTQAIVTHVINASDAIDLVNKHGSYDVILMDIQLPDMNGWQATKIIKKINKNIPIITQSAFAMEAYAKKSSEAGCDYFISKPIDCELLFNYMHKAINSLN